MVLRTHVLEAHAMAPKWQAAAELFCCDEEVFSIASGTLLLEATAIMPSDIVSDSTVPMIENEDLYRKGQQLLLALLRFWYLQCQHQSLNASERPALQALYTAHITSTCMTRSTIVHYVNMLMLSSHVTNSLLSGHPGTAQQPHALILSATLVKKLASLASHVTADEHKATLLALWHTVIQVSCKLNEHYSQCQLVHTNSPGNDPGTEQELNLSPVLVRLVMSALRQSFKGVDMGPVACCKMPNAMLTNQNSSLQVPVYWEILRLGEVA